MRACALSKILERPAAACSLSELQKGRMNICLCGAVIYNNHHCANGHMQLREEVPYIPPIPKHFEEIEIDGILYAYDPAALKKQEQLRRQKG
jgi:hypothetical protein